MSQLIVTTLTLVFATVLLHYVEFVKGDFECKSAGKFPHSNLNYYYECYYVGNDKFTVFKHKCPELSCFDAKESACSIDSCENDMTSDVGVKPFACPGPGKFPHPDKSRKGTFYKCISIEGMLYAYEYQCLSSKPCYFEHSSSCGAC
ncbi:unnamed protein product [Orchesella dallaii]|uniref:Chitin-binding type-2 domain-containing protein n=1 Tax=Orchesella dallaii TaxID=48710 RepID=A0ABP1R941_9HEXA